MEEIPVTGDSRTPEDIVRAHRLAVTQYATQHSDALVQVAAPLPSSSPILPDLLETMLVAKPLAERWKDLVRCFASLGADQLNYGVFDLWQVDLDLAPVRFLSTMNTGWLDYYGEQRLDLSDSHAMAARAGHLQPYAWGESGQHLLEPRWQQQTQQLTADAGLRASLHIPLPDPLQPLKPAASFTIGSSASEREFFAALQGRWGELMAAVQTFHTLSLGEIRRQELGGEKLSAREVECLSLIADGKRIDRVGDALNLSRSTVDLHLRNARRKLGAVTLAEALGRALATHQVELL